MKNYSNKHGRSGEEVVQHQELLENALRFLKLPTFLENYQIAAQDAARTDLPYERYLLALCEAEMAQRKQIASSVRSQQPAFRLSKNCHPTISRP
jgi:hypothetical protein